MPNSLGQHAFNRGNSDNLFNPKHFSFLPILAVVATDSEEVFHSAAYGPGPF